MTTGFQRGSARLYEFPARGRFAASGDREGSDRAANPSSPQVATTAFGSGWYHEEAIREAERARKN